MQREPVFAQPAGRRAVASYATYREAQRAVDYLSDMQFPVERIAIVAEGLQIVEQVLGRLGYGRAALAGAFSGASVGLLLGLLFGILDWTSTFYSALSLGLYGVLFGAAVGAMLGLLNYVLSGGQRDFVSASSVQAERYSVLADLEVADEADRLLARLAPSPDEQLRR